jgi:hypothetical protein
MPRRCRPALFLPQYDWAVNIADQFGLVIIAGDHLDLSSLVEGEPRRLSPKIHRTSQQQDTSHHLFRQPRPRARDQAGEKVAKWISDFRLVGVLRWPVVCLRTRSSPSARGGQPHPRPDRSTVAAILKRTGRWFWVHHAPSDKSPTSWAGSNIMVMRRSSNG